jgi:uncharacterized membrane protein
MSSNPYDEDGSTDTEREVRRSGDWAGQVPYATDHLLPPPGTALRGRPRGHEGWSGAPGSDGLATFLGWLSVGLGALELVAPHAVARAIGVRPTPMWSGVLQAFGVREIATGAGILANPSSKEWVGLRIGGDLLDLAMLGVAMTRAERPARTLLAAMTVLGIGMLDLLGSERLAERRKAPTPEAARAPEPIVLRSITVGRPVSDVYAFWRDFTNFPRFMHHVESVERLDNGRSRWRATGPGGTRAEWISEIVEERRDELIAWRSVETSDLYNAGKVTFRRAPRDEGTIVTVEMHYAPPGGRIGAALLKLFRKEPGQQVIDDLRRFKQVMETGEVLYSDASTMRRLAAARPHEQRTLH